MEKIWTIIELLRWGTEFFDKHSIEDARLNIELMLCQVLGLSRIELYSKFDKPLNPDELSILRDFVKRRSKREPIQYILGGQQFIDLNIHLSPDVLIPRPETEILADEAVKYIKKNNYSEILDIGTGSGCIALHIAKCCPQAHITAIDISLEAIEIAKKNAELNKLENVSFFVSDILKTSPKKHYDMIISNPPYISIDDFAELDEELKYEPQSALTDNSDGLTFYKRFSEFFATSINSGGMFMLELGKGQYEAVQKMYKEFEIGIIKDYSGIERIIFGKK